VHSSIFQVEFPVGGSQYIPRYWDVNSSFDLKVVKIVSCSVVLNIKNQNPKLANLRCETLIHIFMYEIFLSVYMYTCMCIYVHKNLFKVFRTGYFSHCSRT